MECGEKQQIKENRRFPMSRATKSLAGCAAALMPGTVASFNTISTHDR
jgi:hypothetical protein